MDAVFQVIVVCSDQRITEIPRILGKNIICSFKTQCSEVFDEENRSRYTMPILIPRCLINFLYQFETYGNNPFALQAHIPRSMY